MKYKLFGTSGLRVSELCLGTMTFGTEWGYGTDYDGSLKIFDTYANAGGNFIDTANRYTEGTSEKYLADFIKADRDHFVLATKYSLYDKRDDPNYTGNHRKNLIRSVNHSLKRLGTDYIDLLWLHAWDFTTSVQEVMRGLDDLISQGKIHYLGISDTPAWIVSQANTLADLKGLTPFVGLQVEYSLLQRTPERDLIPMAEHFGLTITPWAPLAGGALTGKYLKGQEGRVKEESARRNERANSIVAKVVEIAEARGVQPSQVAINWCRQMGPSIIPIIGSRKAEQLSETIASLTFELESSEMEQLNEISSIDLGFPHDFLLQKGVQDVLTGGVEVPTRK